jgi:hypothetical protein
MGSSGIFDNITFVPEPATMMLDWLRRVDAEETKNSKLIILLLPPGKPWEVHHFLLLLQPQAVFLCAISEIFFWHSSCHRMS